VPEAFLQLPAADQAACEEVGEQNQQIKNLDRKYPHSISLVHEAIPNKPERAPSLPFFNSISFASFPALFSGFFS
jgi:hypothetical protein